MSKLDEKALDEALLTLRPQVWKDMEAQVLCGALPAAQLPINVEMWSAQFRPYLARAIEAYLAAKPERQTAREQMACPAGCDDGVDWSSGEAQICDECEGSGTFYAIKMEANAAQQAATDPLAAFKDAFAKAVEKRKPIISDAEWQKVRHDAQQAAPDVVERVEAAIRRRLSLAEAGFGTKDIYTEMARDAIAAMPEREADSMPLNRDLLIAATLALREMCNTVSPRNGFTDAIDKLDAAICGVIESQAS